MFEGPAIQDDERVIFFPACARRADDGGWLAPIHAWVFEPEEDCPVRRASLALFAQTLGLDPETAELELFKRRAGYFLVDNEGGKRPAVRLCGRVYQLNKTRRNGHSITHISLAEADTAQVRAAALSFHLVLPCGDNESCTGRVYLPPAEGISVVSDIDDTIKVSQVGDHRALLKNTFLREFRAIDGMAELFGCWAAQGALFHYVSASPWQLFPCLHDFLQTAGFPDGTFHLKSFRWKDRSFFNLFRKSALIKRSVIEQLLAHYPLRRFILVGDSSEQDPELFGELARRHPTQIRGIYIRLSGGHAAAMNRRFELAFAGMEERRCVVFDDAAAALHAAEETGR